MLPNNNSSSMKLQRPSGQRHGPTMPWKSNQTVDLTISELHLASLQDGGKCLEKREISSSTRREKFWMFQVVSMPKTEMSLSTTSMVKSTRDGRLSMLMNTQMNQRKESLMRSLVSMLKEISTSYLNYHLIDILTSSTTEIWSSRLETEERLKSGTSTNSH